MLTAYDASFARVLDRHGVDLVLVGDSLGMVVRSLSSTISVTVADMSYHAAAVATGLSRALLVADLPFLADATPERALDAAQRLVQSSRWSSSKALATSSTSSASSSSGEIPVCAHLGLTPQSGIAPGGLLGAGREERAAARLHEDALAVAQAGANLLVLECVPSSVAASVTATIAIPTIGIGAEPGCDGQVLVLHDMLGLDTGHRAPKFVKDFLGEGGSVAGAVAAYCAAVRDGSFPDAAHAYQ